MHALVVDDSKWTRTLLGSFLKDIGFEISYAGHGREALDHLKQNATVNLMLVDWNMPVMNGLELVKAVRANDLFREIRILMVTSETSLATVAQALAAGANEYVMKPFTRETLLEKLALMGIE
jgi:two-component system chemotaxis response regulator CheY